MKIPPCRALGAHCQSLRIILRVASLRDGGAAADHEATWLLGHTERIDFGPLRRVGNQLAADAVLHVPCKFLEPTTNGGSRCAGHGFRGKTPRPHQTAKSAQRRSGPDEFEIVTGGILRKQALVESPPRSRALPVIGEANPCVGAPCRTSDHTRGAACCRDLQVEVVCAKTNTRLEALVRARKSPYLCKVDRVSDDTLGAEMISACAFLEDDAVTCGLHGRSRPEGGQAKPDLCFAWPAPTDNFHPGCVFIGDT